MQKNREKPLAIVMVGLPARGKTYLARKLARYLSWLGFETSVFNVGEYRRRILGGGQPHSFFRPDNQEGQQSRRSLALEALSNMLDWFEHGGEVAIYDATNSTIERRVMVRETCEAAEVQTLFIESICEDRSVIEANIKETKLSSPDYVGVEPERAVEDFRSRIDHYESAYQPIEDENTSFIKVIDVGRKLEINRISGLLATRIVHLLMNVHTVRRKILLTRHGESQDNRLKLIGGDSPLSPRGELYAEALSTFIDQRGEPEVSVWTSTLKRAQQTGLRVGIPTVEWRALDELDAGICDGMSYATIEKNLPAEFSARQRDKFRYRYPRGESYEDVVQRLDPVIVELERQRNPVLLIAHQAIIRVLYSYLCGIPQQECTQLSTPLHTVIELTPTAYGYDEKRFPLGPDT